MSKKAVLMVSILTLIIIGIAIVGQALVYTLGVTYNSSGQVVNPTPLANISSVMLIATVPSFPLCITSFIFGLIAMLERKQYVWVGAIIGAAVFSFVGLIGMALVLLSSNSPIAYATPLIFVPLVTLLYSLRPDAGTVQAPMTPSI